MTPGTDSRPRRILFVPTGGERPILLDMKTGWESGRPPSVPMEVVKPPAREPWWLPVVAVGAVLGGAVLAAWLLARWLV